MSKRTARARTGQDRTGLYQEITDKIIAELEAGRAPWVQPWGTATAKAPLGLPRNACTQRRYSGINVLILWGAVIEYGFAGQSWLTFRQALSLGGHVRKGERGTTVVYADRFTPDDERRRAAETGEKAQAIPFLKRFFVNPTVVKQRLRLAAVSPKLLDIYAEDGMTLEQLMAFTVTADHARQQQVWDSVSHSYNKEPYLIRRQLTEGAVRAADRRALFIGIEAYEAAGGVVMRDLFQHDDGGWLQDPALLDRLVTEKLQAEAEALREEGWKWIEVATDLPYGHSAGLRRLVGETAELTEEEAASFEALRTEYETLEAEHIGGDDLPEAVDQRLGEIETAMAAFENRPIRFDPADITRAGIFVSIDSDGALRVERGFVRPEDEAPVEPVPTDTDDTPAPTSTEIPIQRAVITVGGAQAASEPEASEEDDTIRPLSDRLVTELTAHRTLALRDGVANDPQVAFQAVLHALCLSAFYRYAASTCLEITAKQSGFSAQAPGLAETASAKAIDARQAQWAKQLPETPADLWNTLTAFDSESQSALFAHCASLTVNVVKEPWNRRPDAFAHGDQLARAVSLDMAAAGWTPTVDNYLGRVAVQPIRPWHHRSATPSTTFARGRIALMSRQESPRSR